MFSNMAGTNQGSRSTFKVMKIFNTHKLQRWLGVLRRILHRIDRRVNWTPRNWLGLRLLLTLLLLQAVILKGYRILSCLLSNLQKKFLKNIYKTYKIGCQYLITQLKLTLVVEIFPNMNENKNQIWCTSNCSFHSGWVIE